jgi:hypothetical protein
MVISNNEIDAWTFLVLGNENKCFQKRDTFIEKYQKTGCIHDKKII